MATHRTPGQRAGLSKTAVLAAARSLLAERGLDALTMRVLADHLGVAPNAIYSHVASKPALLDEVIDDVLAGVREPTSADPRSGLREVMRSTYDVLLAHTHLVPVYLARQGSRGPNAQRLGVIMDELLTQAGLAGPAIGEARRVLIIYTIGFAAFSPPASSEPVSAITVEQGRASFGRGLDWLLAGITAT